MRLRKECINRQYSVLLINKSDVLVVRNILFIVVVCGYSAKCTPM